MSGLSIFLTIVLCFAVFNIYLFPISIGVNQYPSTGNVNTSWTSEKIYINNNWSAAKSAGICSGEGTQSEPYIIKDLEIDGGGIGSCILIENSDAFFRIENCTVTNSGSTYLDGGIEIFNSTNGLIINNEVYNHGMNGIMLYHSNYTVVTRNNCYLCTVIMIEYCENIIVYFNNLIGGHSFYNSTIRWYSPQQLNYYFNGRSFTNYLGNYYEPYDRSAQDPDGDGLGNEPYIIEPWKPTPIILDRYPLMETIENYEIINDLSLISGYSLLMLLGITSLAIFFSIRKLRNY
jgi:parallel beta-helix repeat protein